jgi:hypothetical protein
MVDITCRNCKHRDHSGMFTKGGAKPICSHPEATALVMKYRERSGKKPPRDKYNWSHRRLNMKGLPQWCPLKNCKEY